MTTIPKACRTAGAMLVLGGVLTLAGLPDPAHGAAPPDAFGQWTYVPGVGYASQDGAASLDEGCITGLSCGTAIEEGGFFQRSITDDTRGESYFQTIIVDDLAGITGDVTLQAFADENFVAQGSSSGIAIEPIPSFYSYPLAFAAIFTGRRFEVSLAGDPSLPRVATQVSAGGLHTCALLDDKTVRCWGDNELGQIGDGTTNDALIPVPVSGLANVIDVSAGNKHTCAVLADNTLRCWGDNSAGQLGNGLVEDVPVTSPVTVTTAGGTPLSGVVDVDAGYDHTCALISDATMRCWGGNFTGQLGDRTHDDSPSPVTVVGSVTSTALDGVEEISAGFWRTCARLSDDSVLCWGSNAFLIWDSGAQEVRVQSSSRPTPVIDRITQVGAGVEGDPLIDVQTVTTGIAARHSCALKNDGTLRCWGNNSTGQLGDPFHSGDALTPVTVEGPITGVDLSNIDAVSSGGMHACALHSSGAVYCWGRNLAGELGDGTTDNSSAVRRVGFDDGTYPADFTAVSAGGGHSCGISEVGGVRCWGSNLHGQLGDGTGVSATRIVNVSGIGRAVDSLSIGPTTPIILVQTELVLTATAIFADGSNAVLSSTSIPPVEWESDAPDIATVSDSGLVAGVTPGTATITATAGNVSAATIVTVRTPNEPPIAVAGPDQTVECTSSSGATVSLDGSGSSDPDGDTLIYTWSGDFGAVSGEVVDLTLALGAHDVTLTVDDGEFIDDAALSVSVVDTTSPDITPPADLLLEAAGPNGAPATLDSATAVDACDLEPVVTHSVLPDRFPLGSTSVTWTATDASGNSESAIQQVAVVDTTAPLLSNVPADMTVEATSPAGASVVFTAPDASDVVDPSPTLACSPASGSTLALGLHTITCTARDWAGNEASASFGVNVVDTTPPALSGVSSDITVVAATPQGTVVHYPPPSASDIADPEPSLDCVPVSGTLFAAGVTTTVTCIAADASGNSSSAAFQIHVLPSVDAVAPDALPQGATNQIVVVTGFGGFDGASTVSFSGSGVSAGAVSYVSGTELHVSVSVAPDAATGPRDVIVTSSAGLSGTGLSLLTIQTQQETINDLLGDIHDGTATGSIVQSGTAQSLISKLEKVAREIEDGKLDSARATLERLLDKLDGYLAGGKLTQDEYYAIRAVILILLSTLP